MSQRALLATIVALCGCISRIQSEEADELGAAGNGLPDAGGPFPDARPPDARPPDARPPDAPAPDARPADGGIFPSPCAVPYAVDIATGLGHACAVRADGTLWCWGNNAYGQLGDGTQSTRTLPVPVRITPGGPVLTGVRAVAAGDNHTCAIRADGTVFCWGALEDGVTSTSLLPIPITIDGVVPLTDAVSAEGGMFRTCAVVADNTGYCWGGRAGLLARLVLDSAGNPFRPIAQMVLGEVDLAALRDGSAWYIGAGGPTPVLDDLGQAFGAVSGVSAGDAFNCARRWDGTVWCWGVNFYGQLGDGTTVDRQTPGPVVQASGDAFTGATEIESGLDHTCALRADGTLWCWGANFLGQLGDGTLTSRATAAPTGFIGRFVEVDAGGFFTCARRVDGSVWCWGDNGSGQLGIGTFFAMITFPTPVRLCY